MGGQGSGKSTLSQSIVDKYGYKHLDPSAMVDREASFSTTRRVTLLTVSTTASRLIPTLKRAKNLA